MPTPISDPAELTRFAKDAALKAGFTAVGVCDAAAEWANGDHLRQFLALGYHGSMGWMAETADRRAHPTAMWPQARSAIMVGLNYGPGEDPLLALDHPRHAAISVYARGDDYHDVVKKALKRLAGEVSRVSGHAVKVFVDTAPLMEKPLAQRAGLGWQGKHTNLVSRDHGSWLFLGAVLTTAELAPDLPEQDHCGSCRACLDICPTNAFPAPYQLDARRCLSYLTIEHAGPIPTAFRKPMGNRIYGCDDCLAVCPWNKFAAEASEVRLQARDALRQPSLLHLATLDDAAFRSLFAKNPIKRIGRDRFIRNVCIALGNAADSAALPTIAGLLNDQAAVVRGAAVWALRQLVSSEAFDRAKQKARATETDASVLAEWKSDCV